MTEGELQRYRGDSLNEPATIRLAPVLPTRVAVCGFPGVEEAVQAVGEVINKGVQMRKYLFLSDQALLIIQNASSYATLS